MATFREKYGIADDNEIPVVPTAEDNFNAACERYRAMRWLYKGKPFEEQRDAINKFRAGIK